MQEKIECSFVSFAQVSCWPEPVELVPKDRSGLLPAFPLTSLLPFGVQLRILGSICFLVSVALQSVRVLR